MNVVYDYLIKSYAISAKTRNSSLKINTTCRQHWSFYQHKHGWPEMMQGKYDKIAAKNLTAGCVDVAELTLFWWWSALEDSGGDPCLVWLTITHPSAGLSRLLVLLVLECVRLTGADPGLPGLFCCCRRLDSDPVCVSSKCLDSCASSCRRNVWTSLLNS